MQKKFTLILIFLFIAIITILNVLFIVDQRQQALLLQFGKPIKIIQNAGLYFKKPFVQNIIYFDNRLLDFQTADKEVITLDQKRLFIDAFIKYKITDPLTYYKTVQNDFGIKNTLDTVLNSSLKQIFGKTLLTDILSKKHSEIVQSIQNIVDKRTKDFGIQIVDVRIIKSSLPKENSDSIYLKMKTQYENQAKKIRAEGEEESQKIIANADKDKIVLLAEARKKAEILKGEGDAIATKIFANAFNRDPSFFEFYRSMQAYKKSFKNENTKFILSPDNDFLKNFGGYGKQFK